MSFLLYWAFVREVSIKLYLSYEFFSYDRHDRYDRYNDMETRLYSSLVRPSLFGFHDTPYLLTFHGHNTFKNVRLRHTKCQVKSFQIHCFTMFITTLRYFFDDNFARRWRMRGEPYHLWRPPVCKYTRQFSVLREVWCGLQEDNGWYGMCG